MTTDSAAAVTNNSATLYGNVTSLADNAEVTAGFKYGTSDSTLTSIIAKEDTKNTTGLFSCDITGLTANTQYYYKAFAANGTDTVYGEVKNFKTAAAAFSCGTDSVKDIDNNWYHTVQIGNQCWMKENLRTSTNPASKGDIYTPTTEQVPGYDVNTYGLLYNWMAVMQGASSSNANPSGVQGICPTGWHVPSDAEWTQLTDYVSSQSQYVCGSSSMYIAKALASTTGWNSYSGTCCVGNNQSDNIATGFSAVPAGDYHGSYIDFGDAAYFWSATQNGSNYAYHRNLYYYYAGVSRDDSNKSYGFSVRCLRNN